MEQFIELMDMPGEPRFGDITLFMYGLGREGRLMRITKDCKSREEYDTLL